jgi:repressor of nif and glnA expression
MLSLRLNFRYSHRLLNVKKLLAVKFSFLGRNMTVQRMQKLHRLPEVCRTDQIRSRIEGKVLSHIFRLFDHVLTR